MFGLLRTTLALMVMLFHLLIGLSPLGFYAVFGFYTISGYLMTLVMHESYGYSIRGRYAFLVNRLLRLYPLYWAAAVFSIALILVIDSRIVSAYHSSMFMPRFWQDFFSNLFMIFPAWHPNEMEPRLVPPTWALTVEIFFYVLICLGLSKTITRVKIWFLFSISYIVFSFIAGWPSADRYFPVPAASLPFSIGAIIFFISKADNVYLYYAKIRLSSLHLFVLMLANCFLWMLLSKLKNIGIFIEVGFYINQVICALLVYSLVKGDMILPLRKSIDKLIGDFSYPVYLLHWQAGLLVSFLVYGAGVRGFTFHGGVSFGLALVVVFLISSLLIICIDKPVQRIRDKIKS